MSNSRDMLASPVCLHLVVILVVVLCSGCPGGGDDRDRSGRDGAGSGDDAGSSGGDNGPATPDAGPVTLNPSEFTYVLSESGADLLLWTAPATHKIRSNERPPEESGSGLRLHAARREFEPVQLVLGPATGEVSVEIAPFERLGSEQRTELALVGYEDGWAETLTPLSHSESIALDAESGQPIWLTVYVPDDASAGEHTTELTIRPAVGEPLMVPVRLYVFDFSIPDEIHFASQLNISVSELRGEGGSVDAAKTLLFEHRFTPKSVAWPSGFNWNITWENDSSTAPCELLWDEPDEPDAFAIRWLAPRYMLGDRWNGIGFPNSMVFQFVNNSTPRPDSFCGIERGDHYGSDAYNTEWGQFLGALEDYLENHGLLERAYYYVQNEPQDEEDHRLAAHLCRLYREASPDLRLAISEEPKPEIAESTEGGCGYDIWIAHIRSYQEDYAWARQRDHGEEVWFYSLDHDPDPFFNPTRVDLQGIHQRIIPWVSWRCRATGWAYYDANRFFDGSQPNIRAELLREGFEDYEYLYLANGGSHPRVFQDETADATVLSVASSLTSWSRDSDALMLLRRELGFYIEGSRDTLPVLEVESDLRPRDSYYLNFQDPTGQPDDEPLIVDGHSYTKIGWQAYDEDDGYGWYGEHIDNPDIAKYGYDDVSSYPEIQRSYLYDDYGRANLFEFALENGRYEVTVGVGRPSRGYPGDPHNLAVEGVVLVDDELTTDDEPTITRSTQIDLIDGSLSIEMGGRSQVTDEFAYTFLGFVEIEPID